MDSKLKKIMKKSVSLVLAILMAFSGIQGNSVSAASGVSFGRQAKVTMTKGSTISDLWGTGSHSYRIKLGDTTSFCMDAGASMSSGIYMDRAGTVTNTNIKKTLNWYYSITSPTDYHFWLTQTVIWGIQKGKITNPYDDFHKVWAELDKVYLALYGRYAPGDTIGPDCRDIAQSSSSGTFYIYEYTGGYQRVASAYSGAVPVLNDADAVSTKNGKAVESVELTIIKTDVDRGNGLAGVDFELYRDNSKVTTVTTDSSGKASYTFEMTHTKSASASAKYIVNYSSLSPDNKAKVTSAGYYTSKSAAEAAAGAAAQAEADRLAKAELGKNHTYKAVEVKAKKSYYLDSNNKPTLSKDFATTNGTGKVEFSFTNQRQTGDITITKVDSETNNPVAGAVYGLYARENILYPDNGAVRTAKGQLAYTLPATNSSGKATITGIYLGSYYIKEITAPKGYVLNAEEYDITLSPAESSVAVVTGSKTVKDKIQRGQITVVKTDDTTNKALAGAVFELYAKNDIVHPDGKTGVVYAAGTKIATFPSTDANGKAVLSGLYLGDYYIKETKAPTNYVLDSSKKNVSLTYTSSSKEVSMTEKDVTNHRQEGTITITKLDKKTNNTVAGAVYGLYAKSNIVHPDGVTGTVYSKNTLVAKFPETDENGKATLSGLYLGEYYVKEITAPKGYILNSEKYNITLTYAGQSVSVTPGSANVIDEIQKAEVTVIKKDKELADGKNSAIFDADNNGAQGDASLKKAEYGLYAKADIVHPDGVTGVIYVKDALVKSGKTDSNGEIRFTDLYNGKYYVKEIAPSEGYLLDTTKYDVDLTYTNQDTVTVSKSQNVFETVKKQGFELLKVGQAEGSQTLKKLEGAEFTVKLESDVKRLGWDNAPAYDVITTDKNGIGKSIELPYGTYRVRETKVPENYTGGEDFFITISEDSRTPQSATDNVVINKEFSSLIKIVKKDAETGNTVKVAGAEFKIKALTDVTVKGIDFKAGDYIEFTDLNILNGLKKNSWTTNKDGFVAVDGKFGVGEYQLEEIAAPNGYLLDTTPVKFTVSADSVNESLDGTPILTVVKKDKPVKGQITVEKQGEVLTGYEDGKFIYETKGLEGAVFNIIAKEDIKDASNNNVLWNAGSVVEQMTTDSTGKAVSSKLPLGKYEVVEASVPAGYIIDKTPHSVTLKYKDQTTSLVKKTVSLVNDKATLDVNVYKDDTYTDKPVEGAEISISAKENIYANDGTLLFKEGDVVRTVKTDKKGKGDFGNDLPMITYHVYESKAPDGYVMDNTKHSIDGTYKGDSIPVVEFNIEFRNAPTVVEVSKQDITTEVEVAGNRLTVTDSNGNVVDSWTSVQGETHFIRYLHIGETYTLTEELAAYGYLKANDVKFIIADTGEVQKVVMKDELAKGQITVEKQGEVLVDYRNGQFVYETKPLSGAVYEIYAAEDIRHPDNHSADFYKEGDLVATLTTDDSGKATTEKLPLGKYTVVEKTAPHGYIINAVEKEVELAYKDQVTAVVFDNASFTNERQKFETQVTKYDDENSNPLAGAEFTLTALSNIKDYKGNIVVTKGTAVAKATSGTDGRVVFDIDLPVDYKFSLTETKQPDGYVSTTLKYTVDTAYQGQNKDIIVNTYSFRNKPTIVDISKQDITTEVEVAGNRLYVLDENNNKVDSWVSTNEPHRIKHLVVGKTYTLVEELAKEGYLVADSIQFTIMDTGEIQSVIMKDERVVGTISVEKKGEVLTGYEDGKFIYETKGLKDAKIEIYAAEDIRHPDGVSEDFYKKGDLVATLITDENGEAFAANLPLGKYIGKEVTAPNGTVLNTEEFKIELSYIDQYTKIVFDDFEVINERQKVEVHASKTDAETDEFLSGAQFTLTADEDIRDYLGNVIITAGTVLETVTTDENGKAEFTLDLPLSEYSLSETRAPIGYSSTDKVYSIDAISKDADTLVYKFSYNFENDITKVEFTKTDITTGKPVKGAELSIIPLDENGNPLLSEVFATWMTLGDIPETDKDESIHLVKGLEPGRYILREVLGNAVNFGYVTAEDVEFTVEDTGEIQRVEMKDDYTKVEISKTDITTGEYVVGTELSIIPLDENGQPKLGEIFTTWVTEDKPHYIEYLPIGDYILREKLQGEAWDSGYVTAEDVRFTINDTGVVQKVEMKDDYTKVEISKTDITTGESVPGAQLSIIPVLEDGTLDLGAVFATWITGEEPYYIEYLPIGKYVLREVLGEASVLGYVTAEDVEFTVEDTGEIQRVEMKDDYTKVEIHKTDALTGAFVPGAQLSIIPLDENGNALVGETYVTWLSEDKAFYIERLPIGKYILRENAAPDGFHVAEDIIIEIRDTGEVQMFEMKDEPILTDVVVNKVDSVTKKPVISRNFVFAIYADKECTQLLFSENANTVDGTVTFKDLRYGTYYIRELEAPKGYKISDEVKVIVIDDNFAEAGNRYSFEYENTLLPSETVIAGDNAPIIAFGGTGFAALLGIFFLAKKRKKEEVDSIDGQ